MFEAWEGWPVPSTKGKLDSDHHRRGCGSSNNSRPTRRRSCRHHRGGVPAGAAARRPRRPRPHAHPRRGDRPGRTRGVAGRQRLQARGRGRVSRRVRAPRRHLRHLPAGRPRTRCGSSSSATNWNRSAPSPCRASAAWRRQPAVRLLSVEAGHAQGLASRGFITDYLPPDSWVALVEPGDLKEQAKHFFERVADPTGLIVPEAAFANLAAAAERDHLRAAAAERRGVRSPARRVGRAVQRQRPPRARRTRRGRHRRHAARPDRLPDRGRVPPTHRRAEGRQARGVAAACNS